MDYDLHLRSLFRYDVEGHVTRAGKPAGEDDPPPASATAPVLLSLVAAGAAGVAKSATPPLNLGCGLLPFQNDWVHVSLWCIWSSSLHVVTKVSSGFLETNQYFKRLNCMGICTFCADLCYSI